MANQDFYQKLVRSERELVRFCCYCDFKDNSGDLPAVIKIKKLVELKKLFSAQLRCVIRERKEISNSYVSIVASQCELMNEFCTYLTFLLSHVQKEEFEERDLGEEKK